MKDFPDFPEMIYDLRRRAEQLLEGDDAAEVRTEFTGQEVLHLIRELDVHRIELQLQNEELRAASQELQELLARYAELYEAAPIGYVTTDSSGEIRQVNVKASQMLGVPKHMLLARAFTEFLHPQDHGKYFELVRRIIAAGRRRSSCELRLVGINNMPVHVQLEVSAATDDDNKFTGWRMVLVEVHDRATAKEALTRAHAKLEERVRERTSELTNANEALQESANALRYLSSRLFSIQEEERRKLARELHDSLGQTLSALKFSVESALQRINRNCPEDAFKILEMVIPSIQRAIEETRIISAGLRPSILDDLGILTTIGWFCREFQKTYLNHCVEVESNVSERDVPEELKIVIFRILQEAFNNIAKHSHAQLVNLSLKKTDKALELTIVDNGVGFDVEAALSRSESHRGLGLTSMRERVELSGGAFTIESQPGAGTAIRASWPQPA